MFGLHKSTKKASARQQIAIQGVQDGVWNYQADGIE